MPVIKLRFTDTGVDLVSRGALLLDAFHAQQDGWFVYKQTAQRNTFIVLNQTCVLESNIFLRN